MSNHLYLEIVGLPNNLYDLSVGGDDDRPIGCCKGDIRKIYSAEGFLIDLEVFLTDHDTATVAQLHLDDEEDVEYVC